MEHNLYAELLASFSNLTPWVQALLIIAASLTLNTSFYLIKQTIVQSIYIISKILLKEKNEVYTALDLIKVKY